MIAVAEGLARMWADAQFLYVGTSSGPEAALARAAGLPYVAIRTGRWRRYRTWRNLTDPALVAIGLFQALRVVRKLRPDVAIGAGGFATVPPLLAARALRVPVVVHQQDVAPGLANRILSPFAARVTVAFPESRLAFGGRRACAVGNPVRSGVLAGDPARARAAFDLDEHRPVVLITGGGTGAVRLNQIAAAAARALVGDCQLIHLTGAGKATAGWTHRTYRQYEFLASEMADALSVADVVVSRAGMSTLSEIAALAKPAVLVPMPGSHQEANAAAFARQGAAIVLHETQLTPTILVEQVRALLGDRQRRQSLGAAAARVLPPNATDAICQKIAALVAG